MSLSGNALRQYVEAKLAVANKILEQLEEDDCVEGNDDPPRIRALIERETRGIDVK